MKKIYLLMTLLCGVLVFSACSKDDDDDNNEIVGKWTMTEDYFLDSDGAKFESDTYKDGEDVYYFNADGTGKNVYKYTEEGVEKTDEDTFTYTYDAGKKLLTKNTKEGETTYTEKYNVSFSGSKATATATEPDEDGDIYVMVLKKI